MDFLKKLWPTPFKIKKGNVVSFVVQLLIFLVLTALFGWLIGLLAGLPIVGIVFSIVGSLMGIYTLVGAVLCLLKFLDLIK
ncbi:MAG: hypothetical protein IJ009_01070 [Clostridia bacterium]|nr:hypothetical protein [Clostridia bacterium]